MRCGLVAPIPVFHAPLALRVFDLRSAIDSVPEWQLILQNARGPGRELVLVAGTLVLVLVLLLACATAAQLANTRQERQ